MDWQREWVWRRRAQGVLAVLMAAGLAALVWLALRG